MGIEDESNLSQPDFCEKTKKLNMSTTRVEFTQIEAHHFTFELPTHVAEWYKTNRPGEEPDLTFKDDCWEVTWGEEDTVLRISKGCEQVERMDMDHIEYTEIDEAEELRKKAEFWEKQAKRLEAELDFGKLRVMKEAKKEEEEKNELLKLMWKKANW